MRTTIKIEDGLLAEAKAQAARSGRTLAAVVEDALRSSLARRGPPQQPSAARLPTFAGGPTRSGVDLDDGAALLDLMESSGR